MDEVMDILDYINVYILINNHLQLNQITIIFIIQ